MSTPLTDSINALTTYANEVTGGSDTNLSDAVHTLASGYGGGGDITDGIVVTARNANGRATSVDFYGDTVHIQQFINRVRTDGAWIALQSVTFKNTVTAIENNAFYCCGVLSDIDLSTVATIGTAVFQECISLVTANLSSLTGISQNVFLGCTALSTVSAPLLTNCNYSMVLRGCTALETVQLGSVGHGVTSVSSSFFQQDTQTGLTITIYTKGSYVDTAVTSVRNGATNATIIIKASEATTYGGTSYAAGDTIVTSTP